MVDKVLKGFLSRQLEAGMQLARESDLLELIPVSTEIPDRYIARFRCKGLVRGRSGEVKEANEFAVGVWFPHDYLRSRDPLLPFRVLTWLSPREIWHPNISNETPFICAGRLTSGTELVWILYQVFEIITYNKVTMIESDALNKEACSWARCHIHRFPVDRRPLKRRVLNITLNPKERVEKNEAQQ